MEKVNKNVDEVLTEIKTKMNSSSDFFSRTVTLHRKKVLFCFLESVSSDDKISDFLMRSLSSDIKFSKKSFFEDLFRNLQNTITNSKLTVMDDFSQVYYYLASGFTCIFVDGYDQFITVETKSKLDRGVSEASSEAIIRGPKDSFTENHMTNIGLIRKRIKDPNLWMDEVKVGRRTKTKVAIGYIQDIVPKEKVNLIRQKLEKIDIDGILDSGYIMDFLSPKQHSSFPKIISTERPDLVCSALLDGKICILVENSPFALVMPGMLVDFLHSPEDNYQKTSNVIFTRWLRITAFLITLLTPAIYIAITNFNQEMIPDRLLISLAVQREGVPFPTAFEILMLGITFEMLRESDIRIPKVTGTAISVVGALVLGDAAVNAGIVSPIVVIIIAITSICGLLFTDVDFINAVRGWRIFFIFCASIMGIVGIVAGGIIFVAKLASLESLGTPYLTPISPLNLKAQKDNLIRTPRNKLHKRPEYLAEKNQTRLQVNIDEK